MLLVKKNKSTKNQINVLVSKIMQENSQNFMKRALIVAGLCTLVGGIDAHAYKTPLDMCGDSKAVFRSYSKIGYISGNFWMDEILLKSC